jgi:hypothetical protein
VTTERLEIDHIVVGVADLDVAADALLDRHGLVALPGGRHPGWGTKNRVVPLGSTYLELVAVVDPTVATGSAFGSWVADMAAGRGGWGWAVRTHDMDASAARLGLDVEPGSRITPSGTELRWRLAGIPIVGSDRALPFFISWGKGTPLPGTARADHRVREVRLGALTVEADSHRLARWLGETDLPVDVVPGGRGVVAVDLETSTGTIRLRPWS